MNADRSRAEIHVSIALCTLTVTSGAIDAITFLGLGQAPGIAAARPGRGGRRWFVIALTAEVAVLCATGLYAVAAGGTGQLPGHSMALTAVALAFAMGWRTRVINQAGSRTCPPRPSRSRW
ncbi:hypothetical protein [Streptomyces sp. NPDC001480]|uniref:hypothetical protein n=1 Tax=Streptomyces sp. NPDC001480 TaxID=3364577 RepID=UPI0036B450EF